MENELLDNPLLQNEATAEAGRTYTFYEGLETNEQGHEGSSHLYNQAGYSEATEDDLRAYFEQAENLQQTFGDFDTYLAYMNERQDLIDSGEYDPGSWGQTVDTGGLTYQDPYGFEISADDYNNMSPNDFMATYGIDKSEVQVIQTDTRTVSRRDGYVAWLESDAVQQLNEKYGISDRLVNDDGREYMWNGTAWVKVVEPESFDFGTALQAAAGLGMSVLLTPAVAGVLAPALGAAAANGVAGAIVSSALGLAQGEDVSLGDALRQAATGFLSTAAMEAIGGAFDQVGEFGDEVSSELANSLSIIQENNPDLFEEIVSSGGLLEQAIGEGTGAVEQILTDIAGWAGNEAVDFVWDATNSDGEDAIEGEVNEEGDFVFEGGDIAVTIPDFQLPTQETEEGGGGGADSGGGDTGSVGGGGDVADPEWTYRGDGVWVNNSGEWYRVETTGDEQIGDTISTDGLIDVYGNPIESGVDFEAGDPTQRGHPTGRGDRPTRRHDRTGGRLRLWRGGRDHRPWRGRQRGPRRRAGR